jgi:sulfite reductase beta subunit
MPKFTKLAIPFLPNNPPRWPEVVDAVKIIVNVYKKHAKKYERVGEMIERIGWPKFFKLTGFQFTKYHIDDYRLATTTYQTSTHMRRS